MEHSKKPARLVLARVLFIFILILNFSCVPVAEPIIPDTVDVVTETGNQSPDESTIPLPPVSSIQYINEIQTIAQNSTCASYSWAGRGRAPAAYIKGMTLTYARSLCRLKTTMAAPTALVNILSVSAGSSSVDALALYGISSASGEEALRALYTLGVGLGMRESSGKYCEGRDMSASNTSADTAEAGIFQTSYNSISASSELSKLYAEYKADTSKCFLDVYKVGISCGSSSIAGVGAGADYQAFNKSCPAFASEYAMIMLRVRRSHYGPINRKEAEVAPVCNQMLKSVQTYIENNIYACDEIL